MATIYNGTQITDNTFKKPDSYKSLNASQIRDYNQDINNEIKDMNEQLGNMCLEDDDTTCIFL